MTQQSDDTEYFAKLLASLPISLRRNVARHFRTTAIGALVDRDVREARANDPTPRKEVPEDLDFWRKIVEEERFREVVQNGQSRRTSPLPIDS